LRLVAPAATFRQYQRLSFIHLHLITGKWQVQSMSVLGLRVQRCMFGAKCHTDLGGKTSPICSAVSLMCWFHVWTRL